MSCRWFDKIEEDDYAVVDNNDNDDSNQWERCPWVADGAAKLRSTS